MEQEKKGNVAALLPIGVFLLLYLGLGIVFEYAMGISMGFYNIPIVVVFLIALLVACLQNRALSFDDKLAVMGKGIDKTIVTMVLIFMAAGIFVGVGRDSAESVAYLLLSVIPAEYAVAVLFVVSCFVSVAMGTSVGTITLITPIAVAVSSASGFDMPCASRASWAARCSATTFRSYPTLPLRRARGRAARCRTSSARTSRLPFLPRSSR
ncbi:MAG: Na+/H+ antiporter NhaC family protein [Slackia sp.]